MVENVQKSHFFQARIWSGIFTVQGTESIQMGQEQIEQQEGVIGKQQEKIEQ